MTFKIYGYGLSHVNLSNEEREIKLPDVDTLIAAYNKAINGKASKINEKFAEKKPACEKPSNPFEIQSVLSNKKKKAFTVVWADGTTTVVHCQPGDKWDDEKALAMCFTKKALGNKGNFNDKFNDALDNKMKVIPAPEKACTCDGTCKECKCGVEKRYDMISGESLVAEHVDPEVKAEAEKFIEEIDKMKKSANIVTSSFKEMINELTGKTSEAEDKPEPAHTYKIYIRTNGMSSFDGNKFSIESLRKRVHEIAEELYGRKPHYYRAWMGDNDRMIIDFGHHTQFIEIEGITPSEYAKQ